MSDLEHQPDPAPRRWAWRVGSVAGIAIYLHATFVLLLAWIAMSHLSAGHGLAVAGQGLLLIASVFAIVVLHELGHALTARRFGIPTRDITLYPIGGIARLERMPEQPRQELLVAVAGPAVNAVLAVAIYLGLRLTGGAVGDPLTIGGVFAVQLMWINISLAAFNLLPAFPMDGGRILRAILAFWLDRGRATSVAASVGRAFAVVMGVVGLFWSTWLVLIAVFVWFAAGQEALAERTKSTLRGVSVADAMIASFQTLSPDSSLGSAAAQLATGFQHDFPVVDEGRVIGMLTRDDILRGIATRPPETQIASLMHVRFPMAAATEELAGVLSRLPRDGTSVLVLEHERLIGMLDPEHVAEVLAVRRAAQRGAA